MSLTAQTRLSIVLFEENGASPLSAEERFNTMVALLEKGYAVAWVNQGDQLGLRDRSHLLVLGRFDDDQPGQLVRLAGESGSRCQEISGWGIERIVEYVERIAAEAGAARPGTWKPWFPVIDYDRCTNCMQCLSFCLFGVYGVDEQQRIRVQTSDQCKTNCPACARVCPEAAIIFPRYSASPISGDFVSDADLQREKMKIDVSALLGGDVYQVLRERSERAKSRFSKERNPDQALAERRKCLAKLAQMADIPPEVLMSLPSPEEIQRKAEEAKAKARAALTAQ